MFKKKFASETVRSKLFEMAFLLLLMVKSSLN